MQEWKEEGKEGERERKCVCVCVCVCEFQRLWNAPGVCDLPPMLSLSSSASTSLLSATPSEG